MVDWPVVVEDELPVVGGAEVVELFIGSVCPLDGAPVVDEELSVDGEPLASPHLPSTAHG